MTEEPLTTCPECHGKVKRLIGAGSGLIFKGSGFYITDYKKSTTSPASTSQPASGNGGDKTESKPEKKSESKTTESKTKKEN
jgi:predicted nucleic acid-binding Zn ribbon protein